MNHVMYRVYQFSTTPSANRWFPSNSIYTIRLRNSSYFRSILHLLLCCQVHFKISSSTHGLPVSILEKSITYYAPSDDPDEQTVQEGFSGLPLPMHDVLIAINVSGPTHSTDGTAKVHYYLHTGSELASV